ncbi:hypothetical protein ICW40_01215 [Actinotalea ferrariae]|uniref:hypothetical protein n=1 Tax=Actinotalea ferrariae TaxID=1386098 RepID=UPI001C8B14ED|nr:hypothetical protein [Actinotalea ferrariae]MBX9243425.1 hypothetical protein [Actinotalea ferrariae]
MTANAAIAGSRFHKPPHPPECWVNGGPRHHGVRGFRCQRCRDDRQGDDIAELLVRLDRFDRSAR